MKTDLIYGLILGFIIGVVLGWVVTQGMNPSAKNLTAGTKEQMVVSDKATSLKLDMRKLWEDHITWTRVFIIESVANSGGADTAAARLLKNQEEIGDAIKPYYGNDAGNKLTALLKDHILTAAEILKAAMAKDSKAQQAAEEKWSKNAEEIATLLAGANPNWPKATVKEMLDEHLKLTKDEAVARLTRDFDADIAAYDKIHEQALMMADALAEGIVTQFPEKFK